MITRRRYMGGKKSILPSGYKQLEYIENTSSAYIDTGIIFRNNMDCYILYSYENVTQYGYVFGVQNATNMQILFRLNSNQNEYSIFLNKTGVNGLGNMVLHKKCVVHTHLENANSYAEVDGERLFSDTSQVLDGIQTIFMFAGNGGGSPSFKNAVYPGKIKIYQAEFIFNSVLLRDYIPCINPNNVVGMYDAVEGQFYSSPNGTAFIAGPEV